MRTRAPDTAGPFSGRLIDRRRPIRFHVNGLGFSGFVGDTVLSALIAAGTTGAGRHLGHALGLGPVFGPDLIADGAGEIAPLPMDLAPAEDGARYRTIDPVRPGRGLARLRNRLGRSVPSLGLDFDHRPILPIAGDAEVAGAETPELLVVGGGIAGLAAAIEGAEAGLFVVLVERRQGLGGDAPLFGNREGEAPIAEALGDLQARVTDDPRISVLTGCEVTQFATGVFSLRGAQRGVQHLRPSYAILATGAADRLPVFSGNRLPGIFGVAEAFHLARDFGLWPGGDTIIAGASNAAYRMALLAAEAEMPVKRLFDARLGPHSRFREFCKAYGLQMAEGTAVHAARRLAGTRLGLTVAPTWTEPVEANVPVVCEQLITAGGWAPRLRLWVQAGGRVQWQQEAGTLAASGRLNKVALAGSAAGFVTHSAVIASGRAAVARLLKRPAHAIRDPRLAEDFESADAQLPAFRSQQGAPPAYLSRGQSLVDAAAATVQKRPVLALTRASTKTDNRYDSAVLEVADIEALLAIGEIAPGHAQTVIKERGLPPVRVVAHALAAMPENAHGSRDIPAYLAGRFGKKPVVCPVEAEDRRRLAPGLLIFASTDESDAKSAIGVVLGHTGDGARALVRRKAHIVGGQAILRDGGRVVSVILGETVTPNGDG